MNKICFILLSCPTFISLSLLSSLSFFLLSNCAFYLSVTPSLLINAQSLSLYLRSLLRCQIGGTAGPEPVAVHNR